MTTITDIITSAYRIARIRPLQSALTSGDLLIGLDYLNLSVSAIDIDGREISINGFYTTKLQPGNSLVRIPDMISLYTVYYLLGNVRLPIKLVTIDRFYEVATVTTGGTSDTQAASGFAGVPAIGFAQRTNSGIDLNIYSSASDSYVLEVNGIKGLSKFSLDDTFNETLLETYFIYTLASMLRNHFQLEKDTKIDLMAQEQKDRLWRIKPQAVGIDDRFGLNEDWLSNLSDAGPHSLSKGYS